MKTYLAIVGAALLVALLATVVFANPALLPKHPGYPSGGEFAYDTGQSNQTGEKALQEAAGFDDQHAVQNLVDANNQRITQKEGAGRLPKVQGPNIKIEPPVNEATRMGK